ncbi:hypothetical protein KEM55_002034 [Ascosphaera atra]|nr:hypothetical protein KEM55_002034 [Ascosphaera atra]
MSAFVIVKPYRGDEDCDLTIEFIDKAVNGNFKESSTSVFKLDGYNAHHVSALIDIAYDIPPELFPDPWTHPTIPWGDLLPGNSKGSELLVLTPMREIADYLGATKVKDEIDGMVGEVLQDMSDQRFMTFLKTEASLFKKDKLDSYIALRIADAADSLFCNPDFQQFQFSGHDLKGILEAHKKSVEKATVRAVCKDHNKYEPAPIERAKCINCSRGWKTNRPKMCPYPEDPSDEQAPLVGFESICTRCLKKEKWNRVELWEEREKPSIKW